MAIAVNRPLTNCKQLRYNANTHYKDCEGNKICAREPKRAAYAESGAAASALALWAFWVYSCSYWR